MKPWTFSSYLLLVGVATFILPTIGLFVEEDMKNFACQEGYVGEMPQEYTDLWRSCRKHCITTKMSIILDGKVWVYQLLVVLKRLYPGPLGRDTVNKMVDVILQCSDYHQKAHGTLVQYLCYREKVMWSCINKAAD
ncbi:hypothetical protein Ocin01_13504, partial [Orchesella cincta]